MSNKPLDERKKLLSLYMNDKGRMYVDIEPGIGNTMNDEDVSSDQSGMRYYAIEALTFAIAVAAGEQVEAGVEMPMVVEQVMDGITRSLTNVLPGLDIKVGHIGPGNTVVTKDEDNGILPA